jgi:DNA-binding transcriptional MerR regulator
MNHPTGEGLLAIGTLAQRSGLNVSAIRYYEEIGLIPPAVRRPSGHRAYRPDVQDVLTLIRHCRDFNFSIDETKALVSLSTSEERDCVEARAIAQVHLDAVRAKLDELRKLERSLTQYVQACTDQCAGGPAPQCTILKDLGSAAPGCCG